MNKFSKRESSVIKHIINMSKRRRPKHRIMIRLFQSAVEQLNWDAVDNILLTLPVNRYTRPLLKNIMPKAIRMKAQNVVVKRLGSAK